MNRAKKTTPKPIKKRAASVNPIILAIKLLYLIHQFKTSFTVRACLVALPPLAAGECLSKVVPSDYASSGATALRALGEDRGIVGCQNYFVHSLSLTFLTGCPRATVALGTTFLKDYLSLTVEGVTSLATSVVYHNHTLVVKRLSAVGTHRVPFDA